MTTRRYPLFMIICSLFLLGAGKKVDIIWLDGHELEIEIADDSQTRKMGLMNRFSLGENEGMLFVYAEEKRHCMWMRNTYIPLDVAFLDGNGIIINILTMTPISEDSHCSLFAARYALEVNKGWFRDRSITTGATMTLPIDPQAP